MSAQPVERPDLPLFPMPPLAEAALRAAVKRIDLAEAVRFEQEFRDAWQEAVQTDSTIPMRTFLFRWAVFVSLHRYPARSARFRELERAVGSAESQDEARAAASEVHYLLKAATDEVRAG
ncbi:MAG: hypothetical protein JO362_06935 [Streptomycetaceae bacterium]|nr:hypothetical protein [Streptomycetaceae bacterium]